jgi:hypothetical protein
MKHVKKYSTTNLFSMFNLQRKGKALHEHVMKAYRGRIVIALLIFTSASDCGLIVSFRLQLIYPQRKKHRYLCNRRLGGPQGRYGRLADRCRELNPAYHCDARSLHPRSFIASLRFARVYVIQFCRQLLSRIRMELQFHPDPARMLSLNLYDIYHC